MIKKYNDIEYNENQSVITNKKKSVEFIYELTYINITDILWWKIIDFIILSVVGIIYIGVLYGYDITKIICGSYYYNSFNNCNYTIILISLWLIINGIINLISNTIKYNFYLKNKNEKRITEKEKKRYYILMVLFETFSFIWLILGGITIYKDECKYIKPQDLNIMMMITFNINYIYKSIICISININIINKLLIYKYNL